MIQRFVFLYDSEVKPWDADIEAVKSLLGKLESKGMNCEIIDTKYMSDEELKKWREKATLASVWLHQAIRRVFGSCSKGGLPDFGKKAPALLVYEQQESRPIAIYPHEHKHVPEKSIEVFLKEFLDSLVQG